MKIINSSTLKADYSDVQHAWTSKNAFCLVSDTGSRISVKKLIFAQEPFLQSNHFAFLTSGSTGEPRLIVGDKTRSESLVKTIHTAQSADEVKTTICTLPISYSYAFINQWLWAFVMQRNFVATSGFSRPDALKEVIQNSENSMLCLVASQLSMFRKFFERTSFPKVIRVNFAGESFPQEQMNFVSSLFPNAQVFNNYGCTEAMPRLTIRHAMASGDSSNIGRPLRGVELRTDSHGRLLFRSPYSAVASVGPCGVHKYQDCDWIETGDMGEQLPDGSWRVNGRSNEVFKRFGEKVSIAQVVGELRFGWDGSIVGYACDDANGEPGWVLVASPEPDKAQVRALLLALRERYTRAHWPIRVESMESIPRLPNGKVDLVGVRLDENKKLHWRQRI